jgi:tRNA (guanine37-N1)-methyltransferase
MQFDIFTIFPEVFDPYINTSILQRARANKIVEINIHNIRDWSQDKHHTTDDTPFGGGGGMVMKPEPIFSAVEDIAGGKPDCPVILMTPQGRQLSHQLAEEFSRQPRLMILCGRYEGVDERVRRHLVSHEVSIGDYVLSGGELPALVLTEAVTRLLPGALGDPDGAFDDSFVNGLLEYPHYTRPAEFRDWAVPEVLTSGNHQAILLWRKRQALLRTLQKRPELLLDAKLDQQDKKILNEIINKNEIHIPEKIKKNIRGEQ